MALNVLMPCKVADILNDSDDRRSDLALDTQAELGNRRSRISSEPA